MTNEFTVFRYFRAGQCSIFAEQKFSDADERLFPLLVENTPRKRTPLSSFGRPPRRGAGGIQADIPFGSLI